MAAVGGMGRSRLSGQVHTQYDISRRYMKAEAMTLYCGATRGAEAEFGRWAEKFGVEGR